MHVETHCPKAHHDIRYGLVMELHVNITNQNALLVSFKSDLERIKSLHAKG